MAALSTRFLVKPHAAVGGGHQARYAAQILTRTLCPCQKEAHIARRRYLTCRGVISGRQADGIYARVFKKSSPLVMDFRNSKLVCNPLARPARPVGGSNDPYVVLHYEARNMEGLGVPSSSDRADADLFLGRGWLTLLLSMPTSDARRRPEAPKPASLTCSQAVPAGPAPRRSRRRVARSSARRKHPLPTPPW